jgi:hypothetical protein
VPSTKHAHSSQSCKTQTSFADELADGDLLRAWPTLTIQERRRLMNGLLEQVVLTRARGAAEETVHRPVEVLHRPSIGAVVRVR